MDCVTLEMEKSHEFIRKNLRGGVLGIYYGWSPRGEGNHLKRGHVVRVGTFPKVWSILGRGTKIRRYFVFCKLYRK